MGLVIADKIVGGFVINDKIVGGMVIQDKIVFLAGAAPPTENASAPTVAIGAVANAPEGATFELTTTVSGGTYDTLEYAWAINSGGGTITPTGNGSTANYTSASVTSNITVEVMVTVTARGTGTLAINGTSDTATDTEDFTIVNQTPAAAAPTITIDSQGSVLELAGSITLTATISGGTYDAITYAWEVVTGGGTITGNGLSATYELPDVDDDTAVTVRVTATATGTGSNASSGTSDTATDTEDFTVTAVSGFIRFPATAINGLTIRTAGGDVVAYDATNERIYRRSRSGRDDGSVDISGQPDGVVYEDISVDAQGHYLLWRTLSSGAVFDRFNSSGVHQSTHTLLTNTGGSRFSYDIQTGAAYAMSGSTMHRWDGDGNALDSRLLSGVDEQDIILEARQSGATHGFLVRDGRRVNLSTGAVDNGPHHADWPIAGTGFEWQYGYDDPVDGGSIWLFRNDGLAYRHSSGARIPGHPMNQDEVHAAFVAAGMATYSGTMGLPVERSDSNNRGRFVIFDPDNDQGHGATGTWGTRTDVANVPILSRLQFFGDLTRFIFNRNGSVNFEDWSRVSGNAVYMVRISSGTDDVNEYLCIHNPRTTAHGGGSGWLNIMQSGDASTDAMRVASDSLHGSIEGTVMEPGAATIPGLLDDRWASWVTAEWEVATTGREFVVAFGPDSSVVPLVVPG